MKCRLDLIGRRGNNNRKYRSRMSEVPVFGQRGRGKHVNL